MKQNVSPQVAIAVIAVVALLVVVFAYRTLTGPSAPSVKGTGKPHMARDTATPAEQQEEAQWMREHPGASMKK